MTSILKAGFAFLAYGCTEVQMMAPDGKTLVIANSLERNNIAVPLLLTPVLRGSTHGGGHATSSSTASCMSFTAKYGFIGGISEVGMTVNEHSLDLSGFQQPQDGVPTLCTGDFENWVLGTHRNVAELAAALATVRVVGTDGGQWGVADASGASVVVEFVKGVLTLHNNTVGADNSGIGLMTNDPTWDWHLQNLNNFASLQPGWYATNNAKITRAVPPEASYPWKHNAYNADAPRVPEPIGHAYNLLGLPGDGSPPARFIRAFFLRGYAMLAAPPTDLNETMVLAQELLNSVYKVMGTVAARNSEDGIHTTPISSIKVVSNDPMPVRWVFHRSRADMMWRRLDLGKIDFSANATSAKRAARVTTASFAYVDVTEELR